MSEPGLMSEPGFLGVKDLQDDLHRSIIKWRVLFKRVHGSWLFLYFFTSVKTFFTSVVKNTSIEFGLTNNLDEGMGVSSSFIYI